MAFGMAAHMQFTNGVREFEHSALLGDNGCQPASKASWKRMGHLGIMHISFRFSTPKGIAGMERAMQTMKGALFRATEFDTCS